MLEITQDFSQNPEKYYLILGNKISKYSKLGDTCLLKKAYYFSYDRHNNQYRESGEPYMSHPYAVANILADLKLDFDSIIAALLHDTVEDGVATNYEIKETFGNEISDLVEGVTKLSKLQLPNSEAREANNFSKLILAICKDIRILIIKLADRLHNMRTLLHIKDQSRVKKIAKETLEVYAPLAGRVGFQIMRDELEDLAFKEINPLAYQSISKRIHYLRRNDKNFLKNTISKIKYNLKNKNIHFTVAGREKEIYSSWKKMQRKSITFEKVSDIYAFRIVTEKKEDCYKVLGFIHSKWAMVPERFKDFISTPKPNGYESIHTTVIGSGGLQMELQIRSKDMHKIAEYGVASHWIYKNNEILKNKNEIRKGSKWFKDVLEIINTAGGPKELIEHSRMDMYQDNVFCFTPKGDIISLTKNATVLDFAFAVHTSIGMNTIGAKLNGFLIPLNTKVSNGDQIEIITSKGKIPQQSWLNFCRTGKARSQIRKYLRDHEADEFERLGKEITKKLLLDLDRRATKKTLKTFIEAFDYPNYKSFYVALGRGEIKSADLYEIITPRDKRTYNKSNKKENGNSLPITGLTKGLPVKLAECCTPLPGESIVGILTEGKGISAHLLDCSTLERFSDFPELWHELFWTSDVTDLSQVAKIRLTLQNKVGSLYSVTSCVKKINANIIDIKVNKRQEDFFELDLNVQVNNITHLNKLLFYLQAEDIIYKIKRI